MRFCVQCGTALPRGARFCTQCGAPVAPSSAPAGGDDAPTQMARAQREPQGQPGTRLPGGSSRSGSTPGPTPNTPSQSRSPQDTSAGVEVPASQGYPDETSTGSQPRTPASGSPTGPWQGGGATSDGESSTQQSLSQHSPTPHSPQGHAAESFAGHPSDARQRSEPAATQEIPQQHLQQGAWDSSSSSAQNDDATQLAPTSPGYISTAPAHDDDATQFAPVAGSANPEHTTGSSAPVTQEFPQQLPSTQASHDDDATRIASARGTDAYVVPQRHASSPPAQDDDATRMAPTAGSSRLGGHPGASAPATQEIPQQPAAPYTGPNEEATHVAPANPGHASAGAAQDDESTHVVPMAAGHSMSANNQGYATAAPPQGSTSMSPAGGHASSAPGYASQGQPFMSQASAGTPQDAQGFTSSMPQQGGPGHPSQQPPPGHSPQPYASQQPQMAWQPQGPQGAGWHGGQPAWGGNGQGRALDWKPLLPGLLRVAAAILLTMTALGNWWVVDVTGSRDDFATHASVLPLLGCIGVTLAALAQIALLPPFLGGSVPAIGRLAIRAGLCVPALLAVIVAIVTTLGGSASEKFSAVGVTMLAMAVGFAIMGLDDGHDAVPDGTWRWVTAAMAGLGLLLMLVSFIQMISSDDSSQITTKHKWLVSGVSFLFLALVAALIIWVAVTRPPFGLGLITALATGATTSVLLLGWFIEDAALYLVHLNRAWHGGPLLALALAMAASLQVSGRADDTATDDGAQARRFTAWTPYGYGLAALGAFVTAFAFIGYRTEGAPTGFTWFTVLMFLTTALYGVCAYLLKTHPMGRLVAVGSTALVTLTVLITFASAKGVGSYNEMFSEGAYLWVPIIAALALTVPPSVRRVSGSILPQQRPGSGQPAMQGAVVGAHQHGQGGGTTAAQPYGSQPFPSQPYGSQQPIGAQPSYPSAQPSGGDQPQYGQGGYQPQGDAGHGNGSAPNHSPQNLAPNEWEERTQLNRRDDGR